MAQEFPTVEELILIAPAFNMMGVRAKQISDERRHAWHTAGWMPWDDEPVHRDYPIAWKWVEESDALWKVSFNRLRHVKTTILHGLQDSVILSEGSRQFTEQLQARDPTFPVDLKLVPGDHRLSAPEQIDLFQRVVLRTA
jgi:hypothetical protein